MACVSVWTFNPDPAPIDYRLNLHGSTGIDQAIKGFVEWDFVSGACDHLDMFLFTLRMKEGGRLFTVIR